MIRRLPRIIPTVCLAFVLVACSNPLDDGDEGRGPEPGATATDLPAPTLEPLVVVTPTEIDPRRIPSTPTMPPENVTVPETYVVQEGDTLYSIAIQFQLNLADIVSLNGLSDPHDIEVGQELRLPVETGQ